MNETRNDFEICKTIVIDFIAEKLNDDINNLKYFDILQLKYDIKYGCDNPKDFDCDTAKIVNAIIILVWSDYFQEFNLNSVGRFKDYRGDTMNSFKTMFGNTLIGNQFIGDKNGTYTTDLMLLNDIEDFYHKYHTIGNVIVLPDNGRIDVSRKNFITSILQTKPESINNYRGMHNPGFSDYFDTFLFELENIFLDKQKYDIGLSALFTKKNYYFEKFPKSKTGFLKFCNINFLQDYLNDDDSTNNNIFNHYIYRKNITNYAKDAKSYIKTSTTIINNRADIIIKILQKKLDL